MELKKYAKRILKNEPIPNDSRLSYQYYRLFEDRVALVVYDHEKKEKMQFHIKKKNKSRKRTALEKSLSRISMEIISILFMQSTPKK